MIPLIGHLGLRARFADQVARGALPAALLLQGPAGVGKQRLARWLGQLLLCDAPSAQAPCGACQHCRYVGQLGHPDLTWVFPRPRLKDSAGVAAEDVAADLSEAVRARVDQQGRYAPAAGTEGIFVYVARWLVQRAALTPAMARRRVLVVGDADRMTTGTSGSEAANAFLKLLEEPPPGLTIVLTSSEPGALLPTIRSRVVAVRVPPVTDGELRAFAELPDVAPHVGTLSDERLRLAAGAPGALLAATGREQAVARAQEFLAAAQATRARRLEAAFAQGGAKARGTFSDTLDALTAVLHGRARDAARGGDARRAMAAARAVQSVEEAKLLALGNVNPQLVSARLLDTLARLAP